MPQKVRAYIRMAGFPWTNAPSTLHSLALHVDGHYLNAARVFLQSRPHLHSTGLFLPRPPQRQSSTSTISTATSSPLSKKPKNEL